MQRLIFTRRTMAQRALGLLRDAATVATIAAALCAPLLFDFFMRP
jgi:hypothetical protein